MSFEKDNGSNESLLGIGRESKGTEWIPLNQGRSWRSHIWVALNVLLFIISLSLFIAPYFGMSLESDMDRLRKTSFYCKSPPLNSAWTRH